MSGRQLPLELALPPRLGRADFLRGPTNAVALAAAEAPGAWPQGRMLIVGPPGSGRSHLAAIFAQGAGAVILSGRDLTLPAPAAGYAVDDADAVAGAADREETLFHLHNRAAAEGAPVLLTARETPGAWGVVLPDLESRLLAVATTPLHRPDDALLRMALAKLFDERQLDVGADVLDYLVARIDRSLAAARMVVETLDRAALSRHRRVSRPLAAETLARLAG